MALFRPIAFATAPPLKRINLATVSNSPAHSSIGTPSSAMYCGGLRLLVGIRFQVLFHSPPGVLFTFPSRYWCTIGRRVVFSLRRWSSQIPTGFPVSRGTWEPYPGSPHPFRLRGYHPLWPGFPACSAKGRICNSPASLRPRPVRPRYPG